MKFDLKKVELSKNDIKRGLTLPQEPSEELAELIGILTGDGYVSFNKKENKILIVGSYFTDFKYLKYYVTNLFMNLFNVEPIFCRKNNTNAVLLYCNSLGIVSFLRNMGYYKLKKDITIPNWIKNDKKYMKKFIRGVFDTDGCIFCIKQKRFSKLSMCRIDYNML